MVRLPIKRSCQPGQATPVLELGTQSINSNREGVKNQLSCIQVCESRVFSLKFKMSSVWRNFLDLHDHTYLIFFSLLILEWNALQLKQVLVRRCDELIGNIVLGAHMVSY